MNRDDNPDMPLVTYAQAYLAGNSCVNHGDPGQLHVHVTFMGADGNLHAILPMSIAEMEWTGLALDYQAKNLRSLFPENACGPVIPLHRTNA